MCAKPLDILYEDNHLICVLKPPGILSQSDGSQGEDMLSLVGEYLRVKYQKPGNVFVGLVHRLDRNVGGTMVFAKTSKGASRLSEEMRRARFRKGYFALAEGRLDVAAGAEGVLIHHLYKDEKRNIVTDDPKRGKESVLAYRIVGVWKNHTVVFAVPITGRTHQIRAQLAFSGHPLADDVKYGGKRVTTGPVSYPALWSAMIRVKHPTSADILDFRSVPYPMQPWNPAVIELCDNFLKGFHHDELDRLYGLWH